MENVKIIGDYVLTRCKNAFNNNYSYWMSKKGMTVAMYCFSGKTENEYLKMVRNIDSYINYFQKRYEKDSYNPFRKPVAKLIKLLEKERNWKLGEKELNAIGLSYIQYEELKEEYK